MLVEDCLAVQMACAANVPMGALVSSAMGFATVRTAASVMMVRMAQVCAPALMGSLVRVVSKSVAV